VAISDTVLKAPKRFATVANAPTAKAKTMTAQPMTARYRLKEECGMIVLM
jgi:hypothetical protein